MENNLKELLAQRNLTVSEFARITGISQPTMHKIVNGRTDIASVTAKNFMRIAHGLGLSAEQLYFGDLGYDRDKAEIDRVFATTCTEGRQAILASAIGVERTFPSHDEGLFLPSIRDDILAIKGYPNR